MQMFLLSMLCASNNIHPFSLGNYLGTSLLIWNLIIIRDTSVEWACYNPRVRVASCLVCCLVHG